MTGRMAQRLGWDRRIEAASFNPAYRHIRNSLWAESIKAGESLPDDPFVIADESGRALVRVPFVHG
jgi:hypothetical protein